jgi:hypothetical protein
MRELTCFNHSIPFSIRNTVERRIVNFPKSISISLTA